MKRNALALVIAIFLMTGIALAQSSTPKGSDTFDDVPADHWADEAIGWAVQNGITSGVSPTEFDPDGTVTRAQIVTFLHRALVREALPSPFGSTSISPDVGTAVITACYATVADNRYIIVEWEFTAAQQLRSPLFYVDLLDENGLIVDYTSEFAIGEVQPGETIQWSTRIILREGEWATCQIRLQEQRTSN